MGCLHYRTYRSGWRHRTTRHHGSRRCYGPARGDWQHRPNRSARISRSHRPNGRYRSHRHRKYLPYCVCWLYFFIYFCHRFVFFSFVSKRQQHWVEYHHPNGVFSNQFNQCHWSAGRYHGSATRRSSHWCREVQYHHRCFGSI